VKQVAAEQGVRYVLEGSFRQAGKQLRVTAQLIDATTGHHVWAERYDREAGDVFAVQDDITCEVAAALQVKLTEGEYARVRASGTKDLKAWENLVQAADILYHHRRGEMAHAKELVEEALRLDPNYAWAWASKGWLHWEDGFNVWSDEPDKSLEIAMDSFERAIAIDPDNPEALALISFVLLSQRKFDQARAASARSLARGAGYWMSLGVAANIEMYGGDSEVAMNLTRRAMRPCPIYPAFLPADLAQEYILIGQPEKAIPACKTALKVDSGYIYGHLCLAVALVMLGRIDEANKAAEGLLGADPGFSISRWAIGQAYEDPARLALFTEALREAGLPD
jgi:tetratricopeptide (TPR) repeat protein